MEAVVDGAAAKISARIQRPHLPFLDGIRALAALYVVAHHASTNLRPPGQAYVSAAGSFFNCGNFAVDVFIVLSGFSLMMPVALFGNLRGGAGSFLTRRAQRIVPTYLVAVLVSAILGRTLLSEPTGTVWDVALPVSGKAVLAHVALVQDLFQSTVAKVSYPLWSVSVESHVYLLFPALVLAFARFEGWRVVSIALLGGYALQLALTRTPINTLPTGAAPYYVGLFALGCAAVLAAVRSPGRVHRYPAMIAIGAVLGQLSLSRLWTHFTQAQIPEQASSLLVGVAAAAVMAGLGAGQWPRFRAALSWRPLAFCGTFAYSIYLVHAPVLQLIWKYGVHPLGLSRRRESLVLMATSIPAVLVVARLFFVAFERPFIPRSPSAERLAA